MKKFLSDSWNGNLCPVKNCGKNDPEIKNLMELIAKNRDKIEKTFDEPQTQIFETYNCCVQEYLELILEQVFYQGFSLGIKFTTEAFEENTN